MTREEFLISQLPDREAASRFLSALSDKVVARLRRDEGLFSDVLTLASFSPLLATTISQHDEYVSWLGKRRADAGLRSKEDLKESLATFASLHSQLEPEAVYSRFRRRELLRIYLRDIRRLATIAEVTEEISNLADAIVETALAEAERQIDARFGRPQTRDGKGRLRPATFCVIALGKLGSHELNYSSDIDLLFLYSDEGDTGGGSRGSVTNREYFIKLGQVLAKLVGDPAGDSAYRVDLRLRPHGTMGPIAMSFDDTVRYYHETARQWERQVMIRSRACAGDGDLFKRFWTEISPLVFSTSETPESALFAVRSSKERIDRESNDKDGFNVKLGTGGIREIEFIAQALQLAYGGGDPWLRAPHTLVSLSRLADRGHITENELTDLSNAYDLLRRTEHVLQMENGLQTHTIPADEDKRSRLAAKIRFVTGGEMDEELEAATRSVHATFRRIFGDAGTEPVAPSRQSKGDHAKRSIEQRPAILDILDASPHFTQMVAANPALISSSEMDHAIDPGAIEDEVLASADFAARLNALRRVWSRLMLAIARADILREIDTPGSKLLQTDLAEASLATALRIVGDEMKRRYGVDSVDDLAVLALGKLGGRGVDYGSDLDLLLAFDGNPQAEGLTTSEYFARTAELLVNTLSSMTRDGSLYRVDLRLRPFGSKGPIAAERGKFVDYMARTAEIWELLAFVKMRGVRGSSAHDLEEEVGAIIHQRAISLPKERLRDETRLVRGRLEQTRAGSRRSSEIDIKYSEGGMLDVYFAARFLQLRDTVPDEIADRSTRHVLARLYDCGSLSEAEYAALSEGYEFISELDHHIRLTVGRSTRVPVGHDKVIRTIADRMGVDGPASLLENLTLHRLAIREAYDSVLS